MKRTLLCISALCITGLVNAAETPVAPPTAEKVAAAVESPATTEKILADAKTKALAEGKTIYVHFSASWCIWCKRLDALTSRPDIKPIFDKYFVPVTLIVMERGAKKSLENPGSTEELTLLGGPAGGIPYYAFLDAKGEFIISSKRPTEKNPTGENIGYPGDPDDQKWFLGMLKKAAPKMTDEEYKTIETVLSTTKPTG